MGNQAGSAMLLKTLAPRPEGCRVLARANAYALAESLGSGQRAGESARTVLDIFETVLSKESTKRCANDDLASLDGFMGLAATLIVANGTLQKSNAPGGASFAGIVVRERKVIVALAGAARAYRLSVKRGLEELHNGTNGTVPPALGLGHKILHEHIFVEDWARGDAILLTGHELVFHGNAPTNNGGVLGGLDAHLARTTESMLVVQWMPNVQRNGPPASHQRDGSRPCEGEAR